MFHLFKQSRVYNGHAYAGPSNYGVPAEYKRLEDALAAKACLQERNPVGWDIYDTVTGEKVADIFVRTHVTGQPETADEKVSCPVCNQLVSVRFGAWFDRYNTTYDPQGCQVHFDCLSETRKAELKADGYLATWNKSQHEKPRI